jgi:hypothetical protein
MADLGYPTSLASLGAVVGVGAAVVTTGTDARKVYQIAGLAAAGAGLGMMADPDGSTSEAWLGAAVGILGLGAALFGGN